MIPVSSSSNSSSPGIDDDDDKLLSVFYNQEYDCFSAGTSDGFRIYNCDPFGETFRRDVRGSGGFKIVEMLFRSNILALVGSSLNSLFSPNKVLIWDDHQSRCIGEFSFRSVICGVKLRRDRIVIVLEHKIYVYNFTDLKLLHSIDTLANPKGLCCLSQQANTSVLACPGLQRGHVRVEHFGLDVVKMIKAHESHIAFLTLTMDGLLLSTASSRGTLIRIFNTLDGGCLQEVRRGGEKAEIYGIAFSKDVQWLAVSSNKGTVHVFSLRVRVASEDSFSDHSGYLLSNYSSNSIDALTPAASAINPQSSLPFMKGVLPKYFSSEWSFAQFHLKDDIPFFASFGPQNNVVIVGLDGSFYKCNFDVVNGGEMKQVEYVRFMKGSGKFM